MVLVLVSDLVLFMSKSEFRVFDLVLLRIKSESRSRIWYWFGFILSPRFGTGSHLSFCAHWFMFDINATLVVYL